MDTLKLMADNEALENEFSDFGKGPCHETIRPDDLFKTERSKNATNPVKDSLVLVIKIGRLLL